MKMTSEILAERQKWSLSQKIDHSIGTMEKYINALGGVENVFISFSGGKDSMVLLHIARRVWPNIKAVFCNTGNELPETVYFVNKLIKEGYNIEIVRPNTTAKQVWAEHGFPLISKEICSSIFTIKRNPNGKVAQVRLDPDNKYKLAAKWRYLLTAPYNVSNKCCYYLKERPLLQYGMKNNMFPIIGTMADESLRRKAAYIKAGGCNVFASRRDRTHSTPLAIWTEADIWEYIKTYNVPISEAYSVGYNRTGCATCGMGCQFREDNRMEILYKRYPKYYKMIMNYTNNGVTFREAVKDIFRKTSKWLPDEI